MECLHSKHCYEQTQDKSSSYKMTSNRAVIVASKKKCSISVLDQKRLTEESMPGLPNTYPAPKGMLCYNDPESILGWSGKWSILSGQGILGGA